VIRTVKNKILRGRRNKFPLHFSILHFYCKIVIGLPICNTIHTMVIYLTVTTTIIFPMKTVLLSVLQLLSYISLVKRRRGMLIANPFTLQSYYCVYCKTDMHVQDISIPRESKPSCITVIYSKLR